jgi:hypothetical protein
VKALNRLTENIFAIIGGIASEVAREVVDSTERALIIRGFLETLVARADGLRILSLISRALQNVEVRWRAEWMSIINDVLTNAAIDLINKVNPCPQPTYSSGFALSSQAASCYPRARIKVPDDSILRYPF